jgi:hypothetical protein
MSRARHCLTLLGLPLAIGLSQTWLTGAELVFESTDPQTPLLELYTSEGCSSCPPAEAWRARLKDAPGLWRDFVPVAFHVDYWDHLGWRKGSLKTADGTAAGELGLETQVSPGPTRLAVAFWVTPADRGAPIQATDGWLQNKSPAR